MTPSSSSSRRAATATRRPRAICNGFVSPGSRSRPQEKKKPPRIALGETESRFFGMPGQDSWIYRGGIPTLDAWPCGLRRRIGPPPVEGRLEADQDALRDEGHDHRVSRFGSLLGGAQESHASAWSISSSGPKSRALSSALCEIRPPWRPCGRNIRHTLNQPGKLPFSSPPRRATVSRSPTWPACPLTESYLIRSEKTRDKDLKERRDLDHQAFSCPARILVDP